MAQQDTVAETGVVTQVRGRQLPNLTKYNSLPMITEAGRTLENWEDSMVLKDDSYPLSVPTDAILATMVREVLEALSSAVTEVTAYQIILLTWNMRSETDASKRLFPNKSPYVAKKNPAELSTLRSIPAGTLMTFAIPENDLDRHEYIRQGCFIAASLLKLFTKDSSSWTQAYAHISESYKKFTDVDFMFSNLVIWAPSVSALRRLFQTKDSFKNTLGMILYSLKPLSEGRGMTQMLFEQHLSFTGLHIINLFCKACVGLRASPTSLMCALHVTAFDPILDQLAVILKDYMGSTAEGKDRETYKYARLFESKMFSLLQTKNCADVVCILGYIGLDCGNVGSGNVMEIAAIETMSEEAKGVYKKVANNIFNYFKVDVPSQENDMFKT